MTTVYSYLEEKEAMGLVIWHNIPTSHTKVRLVSVLPRTVTAQSRVTEDMQQLHETKMVIEFTAFAGTLRTVLMPAILRVIDRNYAPLLRPPDIVCRKVDNGIHASKLRWSDCCIREDMLLLSTIKIEWEGAR